MVGRRRAIMPSSEELAFLTSGWLSWAEFGVSSWRVVPRFWPWYQSAVSST